MKPSRFFVVASFLALPWFLTLFWGSAAAQGGEAAEDVVVSFGFADEIVADAWNPLRVTLRDLESAELVLELDVGSLRSGPRRLRYSAQLAGGQGLYTFQDDVYLPSWRSFSWLVRTPERVLSSGTVERRRVDKTPVQLVLSREVGVGNRFFAERARVVDVTAADLPERAAAYGGVSSVLVLPGDAPPTPGALVAAVTAGSRVLLVGAPGAAYADLLALAPEAGQRLGAGWLGRAGEDRDAVQRALAAHPRLVPDRLVATLVDDALTAAPAHPRASRLLLGLAGYAAVVLALLRFGGLPGLLAAVLLAAILAALAAQVRPPDPLVTRSRSLNLGAGELALGINLEGLFSFPAQRARVAYAARPLPLTAAEGWGVGPESFELPLEAFSSAVLAGRPTLRPAVLSWQGGSLVNGSEAALGDVFVTQSGQQLPIPAGGRLDPTSGNLLPPDLYADLAPLLPPGSALARGGGTVHVALPETLPEVANP
jgi:hypothetical protein